jgi:hypothetical protein
VRFVAPVNPSLSRSKQSGPCQLQQLLRGRLTPDEFLVVSADASRTSDQQPPLTYSRSVGDTERRILGGRRAEQMAASGRDPGLSVRNLVELLLNLSKMSRDIVVEAASEDKYECESVQVELLTPSI